MVEADVVDCMIALPGQLFYSTQIPACLWFLARNKNRGGKLRDRRGEVLFIDARKLGTLVDRTRKEFSDDDVAKIAGVYHAWREGKGYEDVPGFCKSAKLDEIRGHNHVLTPGRYVGAADVEDDDVPFAERFAALRAKLEEQFAEADKLTATIRAASWQGWLRMADWREATLGELWLTIVDSVEHATAHGLVDAGRLIVRIERSQNGRHQADETLASYRHRRSFGQHGRDAVMLRQETLFVTTKRPCGLQ